MFNDASGSFETTNRSHSQIPLHISFRIHSRALSIYRMSQEENSIFRDVITSVTLRKIILYAHVSKIVDKKEILRTASNTGICCSSDEVCTVYLV
jgi:predicted transport protein